MREEPARSRFGGRFGLARVWILAWHHLESGSRPWVVMGYRARFYCLRSIAVDCGRLRATTTSRVVREESDDDSGQFTSR